MNSSISIAVLVPTWKRPFKLEQCLEHLVKQTRKANQVILVVRKEDSEAQAIADRFAGIIPGFQMVFTECPGVVAAENVGLDYVESDYVAFLDDDGYAPSDWLQKIEAFFLRYPDAGALGGSDIIKSEPWTYHDFEVDEVGTITWYGKIVGNHHRKCRGGIRAVSILKGVNMIFKRNLITKLDVHLAGIEGHLGNGSQWELDLCLSLKRLGYLIYFDPDLVVVHDSDHSSHVKNKVLVNNAHNLTYVLLKHFTWWQKIGFLFYSLIIGSHQLGGVGKTLWDVLRQKSLAPFKEYFFKLQGFVLGAKTYCKVRK